MGELGMKSAIYAQRLRGPGEKLFSSAVKDRLSESALGAWYRTLVSVLAPVVTRPSVRLPTVVAELSETQKICHKGKRWVENGEEQRLLPTIKW